MTDKEKYYIDDNELIIQDKKLNIDLKSNLQTKRVYRFYDAKTILSESYYHEDILHGPTTYFSKEGNVLSKAWFFEGKRYGKAYKYYQSTQLYSIEYFFEDLMHTEQVYYYENGKIKTLLNYQTGILHGKSQLFFEDGNLKRDMLFENGKKVKDLIYLEDGSLIDESKFLV